MGKTLADLLPGYETSERARSYLNWVRACAISSMNQTTSAHQIFEQTRVMEKASAPATTTLNTPALNSSEARAFITLLDRQTVRGRLTGVLSAPPRVVVPYPSNDPRPSWVAEGNPIPVASIDFDAPMTESAKYALIVGFTREIEQIGDTRALNLIERVLQRAARRADDALFLGDLTGVTNSNPAGLLSGLSVVGAGSPSTLGLDLSALWTDVTDGEPSFPHFVVSMRGAIYLASLHEDGTPLFPNVGPIGGDIYGVPVLTSRAAGNKLILIDAGAIAVVDDGVEIRSAREAAVEMDDAPTPGALQVVSGWQTNTLFVKLTRYVSWTKLAADAVAYLELPIGGSPA